MSEQKKVEIIEFFKANKRWPSIYIEEEFKMNRLLQWYTNPEGRGYDAVFDKMVRENGYGTRKQRKQIMSKLPKSQIIADLKDFMVSNRRIPRKAKDSEHMLWLYHNKLLYKGSYLYDEAYRLWWFNLRKYGMIKFRHGE